MRRRVQISFLSVFLTLLTVAFATALMVRVRSYTVENVDGIGGVIDMTASREIGFDGDRSARSSRCRTTAPAIDVIVRACRRDDIRRHTARSDFASCSPLGISAIAPSAAPRDGAAADGAAESRNRLRRRRNRSASAPEPNPRPSTACPDERLRPNQPAQSPKQAEDPDRSERSELRHRRRRNSSRSLSIRRRCRTAATRRSSSPPPMTSPASAESPARSPARTARRCRDSRSSARARRCATSAASTSPKKRKRGSGR